MNENIKITIELSPEEYGPIKKMADYCHTSTARIIEALVQGQAKAGYLDCYCELNWLSITDYLLEIGEDTPRRKRIENYVEAARKDSDACRTIDERAIHNTHFTSLETFEAWQAWNLEKH